GYSWVSLLLLRHGRQKRALADPPTTPAIASDASTAPSPAATAPPPMSSAAPAPVLDLRDGVHRRARFANRRAARRQGRRLRNDREADGNGRQSGQNDASHESLLAVFSRYVCAPMRSLSLRSLSLLGWSGRQLAGRVIGQPPGRDQRQQGESGH